MRKWWAVSLDVFAPGCGSSSCDKVTVNSHQNSMLVRRLISGLALNFATALFCVLHDAVSSYRVISTRHLHHRPFGRSTRLFSKPSPPLSNIGAKDDVVIDHAALSVDDVWEDHYHASHSAWLDRPDDDSDERRYRSPSHNSYISHLVRGMNDEELSAFLSEHDRSSDGRSLNARQRGRPETYVDEPHRHLRLLRRRLPDPLWLQIRLEAEAALILEPDAGPQLYQHVLRQPSLMDALASIISHEIATELMPATALQALVLDQLRFSDDKNIHLDLVASVNRDPSEESTALTALLFNQGLHAMVCYV